MDLSSPGMPPISTFRYRYGGMLQAFDLMGYQSPRSRKYLELWPRTTRLRAEVIAQVVAGIQANGGSIKKLGKSKLFLINEQFTIAIQIIRARFYPCGSQYWRTNFHLGPIPDYRILVRATPGPRVDPIDYFILPQSTFKRPNISLMNKIPASLRPYWNTSLDTLYRMAQPLHAQESPS
jgi:hypothetical protein